MEDEGKWLGDLDVFRGGHMHMFKLSYPVSYRALVKRNWFVFGHGA
jgi:hypothetical protein